jgi:hypothetical protein
MRTVQETFDAVIDAGLYGLDLGQTQYMCLALQDAQRYVISTAELLAAKAEIHAYLEPSGCRTLNIHLQRRHWPTYSTVPCNDYGEKDFTCIYRDWANRPSNRGI